MFDGFLSLFFFVKIWKAKLVFRIVRSDHLNVGIDSTSFPVIYSWVYIKEDYRTILVST